VAGNSCDHHVAEVEGRRHPPFWYFSLLPTPYCLLYQCFVCLLEIGYGSMQNRIAVIQLREHFDLTVLDHYLLQNTNASAIQRHGLGI
jgi:hypothetical protein